MSTIGIIYFNSSSITPIMRQATNTKVINLHVYVGDEELVENNIHKLYDMSQEKNIIPKTSQPSSGEIYNEITEMLERYDDVLIMTPSTDLSGTHQNVVLSLNFLEERLKKHVHIIQTRSFALSEMIVTTRALELIDNDTELDKIKLELDDLSKRITTFIFPGDLNFLRKSGRVNLSQLILGKMAKLRLMIRHVEPTAEVYKKARGSKMLLKYINQEIENNDIDAVYLGSLGISVAFYDTVKELVNEHNIPLYDTDDASIIVASHFGPNSLGLALITKDYPIKNSELKNIK